MQPSSRAAHARTPRDAVRGELTTTRTPRDAVRGELTTTGASLLPDSFAKLRNSSEFLHSRIFSSAHYESAFHRRCAVCAHHDRRGHRACSGIQQCHPAHTPSVLAHAPRRATRLDASRPLMEEDTASMGTTLLERCRQPCSVCITLPMAAARVRSSHGYPARRRVPLSVHARLRWRVRRLRCRAAATAPPSPALSAATQCERRPRAGAAGPCCVARGQAAAGVQRSACVRARPPVLALCAAPGAAARARQRRHRPSRLDWAAHARTCTVRLAAGTTTGWRRYRRASRRCG